jgi:hypothetical protein
MSSDRFAAQIALSRLPPACTALVAMPKLVDDLGGAAAATRQLLQTLETGAGHDMSRMGLLLF